MENELQIERGDVVKHKFLPDLNDGFGMNVILINEKRVMIDYLDSQGNNQRIWVDKEDLEVILKGSGTLEISKE
jgi:hypothetical protein